jgi:long-chain acyl-CoA synthetase
VQTLVDVFRTLEPRRGEAIVYDDGYRVHRHGYEDLTRAARGFATRLAAQGVKPGDHVLFWSENRPEWLVAYWGCIIAGVVVVPIDYRSSLAFAAKVRDIVQAPLALVGDDASGVPDGPGVTVWRLGDLDWQADGPMPQVTIGRDDVAQVVFTSGATAEPKGVVVRHRNVIANFVPVSHEVQKYKTYARPFLPIRFLNLLPLSHLFGQAMAANIPPLVEGTVVFMRSFNPHDIVRRVKEWRISVIVCVPKILEVLKEHAARLDPAAVDPPAGLSIRARWWRYRRLHRAFGLKFWAFIVGAAPLSPSLEDYWKRLGFVVIQGYGLTETAPIVTLNHPFKTNTGSVGTPIAGVEVRIADDGEVLVRGENVTTGYFEPAAGSRQRAAQESAAGTGARGAEPGTRTLDSEGWFHTGDIGELDAEGRLFIRGRKKEMIVLPDGLNVFPDDVERVLNEVPGVVESAVVGHRARLADGSESASETVHAVLVLASGASADDVVAVANGRLQDHQRIRGMSVWTEGPLPRTEGTKKLKRRALKEWVATGAAPAATIAAGDPLQSLIARFAGQRTVGDDTSLEALGLSSLERVELMVALEDTFQTRIDESKFVGVKTLDDLRALVQQAPQQTAVDEPVDFPRWNRGRVVGLIRRASLATWILPLARVFAWIRVSGLEHLERVHGPVIFASNHQSHLDVPVILAAMPGRWRARVAPAMAKEFFKPHFFPEQHSWTAVVTNRLNYWLAAFFFNAFPLPQREAGARQTLRYIGEVTGDGFSVLIFPEGSRAESGAMKPFRAGIGMMASRLDLPVVPVKLDGVDRVLHPSWKMARPGRVTVTFGPAMRLHGDDYAALAAQVEEAVRRLHAAPPA